MLSHKKKAKHVEKMLIEMLTYLAIKCSEGLLEKKDAQWSLGETIMEDLSTAYDCHLKQLQQLYTFILKLLTITLGEL